MERSICRAAVAALAACAWWSAPLAARAGERAQGPAAAVNAAFRPLVLGKATTVSFAVQIDSTDALMPVTGVEVRYPAELGLATSQLGLQTCSPAALSSAGPRACPADSKMGQGEALIEVPFGPQIVRERVVLEIFAAPSSDGYIHLAIAAKGEHPVQAQIVLAGVLLPGLMKITVPPVPTLPGAPYASLVSMRASLGGALTYYERVRGRVVAFRPRGIGLPASCPHGGWRIAASFAFADGSTSRAATVVPCPAHAPTQRSRGGRAGRSRALVTSRYGSTIRRNSDSWRSSKRGGGSSRRRPWRIAATAPTTAWPPNGAGSDPGTGGGRSASSARAS